MSRSLRFAFLVVIVVCGVSPASAQGPATGTPPFGSFSGGPEIINLANLNVHWTVPVLHKPGRGLNFSYDLSYDSSVWFPVTSGSTTTWQSVQNWGWVGQTQAATGYTSASSTTTGTCTVYNTSIPGQFTISNWAYHDAFGISHSISGSAIVNTGNCPAYGGPNSTGFTSTATDGSGFKLVVTGSSSSTTLLETTTARDGTVEAAPYNSPGGAGSGVDRNGNQISVSSSGVFTDTLGTTALTVAGTAPSPTTFTYTAPSGASASYTMKYATYTVQTAFGCNGIAEYGPTSSSLVSEIDLPDGSKYTFTYEQTPGVPANVTGRLASITLPTGGTIYYQYTGGSSGNITCADGSAPGFFRTTPDTSRAWTYARTAGSGAAYATTVTDPQGNNTFIQFQGLYETQRDAYQGSIAPANLVKTISVCYNGNTTNCTTTAVSSPITQRNVTTSIPTAGSATLQTQTIAKYNSVGGLTEFDEYAFGSGAFGALLRQTFITYAPLGNITAFRKTVTVKSGGGTTIRQTTYNYDQTTPVPAPSNTPQLTSVSGSRGNLTSIQRCTNLSSCSSYLQTTMTYDTAGQLQSVTDPLNNQTSFSYADNFLDDDASNPPSKTHTSSFPTDAYVTSITPPLNGALTFKYYYYNGQRALATDPNGNSSYAHFDSIGRPSSAYGPTLPIAGTSNTANPWMLINYTSSTQVDTYTDINDSSTTASTSCTVCRHDEVAVDGLGRSIHRYLISDPEGQTQVDTAYDALGRIQSTSHPHRSAASTTDGTETPSYDALGRTTKVTHPDNTYSQTLYGASVSGNSMNTSQLCSSTTYGLGFPVVAIDEAGKKREFWTDALGRTIEADEPDSTGALNSNTCYSYDPLGNLLQIVHGSQTRTYAYDTLSRPITVTTPESGTTTYKYDSDSNCASPNSFTGLLISKTDARSIRTCTQYDTLNRVTQKNYSDGTTPTVKYGYDGTAPTGCTPTPPALSDSNPKGRMTSMCDGSGATSWAHDAAGRITTEKRTIQGTTAVTETLSYSHNLDGSIATVTYPSGKTVTYTVSNAQRLTAAKDVANNVQFATAASYAPPGALGGVITGQISGGFAGISETHNYNSSLEYTSTKATSTAGTAMDLTVNYASSGDNGSITSITNNADNGRTQTLGYDSLNRISSATTQATSGVDCWGQNFTPDALANLNTITSAQCSSNTLSVTVDGNNHINSSSTFAYDATGNMTQDGKGTGYSYSFDAENRLSKATGMTGGPYCYVYDGRGLRVAKKSGANSDCSGGTVSKLYWRSIAGDALAETDGSGSTTNAAYNEYVFFAGRRIASRDGSGHIFYWFADQLGSTRTITTGSGTGQTPGQLCYDADFTPYGQEISYTGRLQTTACPPNYKFTGYERDPETAYGQGDTGVDYAFARYYSSRLGRFLSTDPLGGSMGDLQSLNKYAYVRNNPLSFVDPKGLQLGYTCAQDQTGEDGGCGGGGGFGGGGGSADCSAEFPDCSGAYMDGIQMPWSTVQTWLGLGWAAQCPNGQCSGVLIGGVLSYFSAYLTGSTYAPYAGPGSIFDTNNQAMIAGAMYAENQSLLNNGNEQCGMTYSDGGQFSYTASQHGNWATCQPLDMMGSIPAGDIATGGYHSHGEFDPNYANERFSGQPGDLDQNGQQISGDIGWSTGYWWSTGLPISVATPGGNVIVFYPGPGCQTFFLGGPAGSGTTVPICH